MLLVSSAMEEVEVRLANCERLHSPINHTAARTLFTVPVDAFAQLNSQNLLDRAEWSWHVRASVAVLSSRWSGINELMSVFSTDGRIALIRRAARD